MKKSYKKTVFITLILAVCLFSGVPALLIFLVDPCHIFHRPYPGVLSHGFDSNPRCQVAGLLNTYLGDASEGFDSIFTGTSLSTNYSTEYIAEKTPWKKALKLTIFSASPIEQKIVTERAIYKGNIKHVFWEVLPFQFLRDKNDIADLEKNDVFPLYLYNNSRLDDYRYIFNSTSLSSSINSLLHEEHGNTGNINRIGWSNQCESAATCVPCTSQEDINAMKADYKSPNFTGRTPDEISSIDFSTAEKFLIPTLLQHCNSDISFDLIFPPLSMLWFSSQNQQDFDYQLYMLRYVTTRINHCTNIRVFAFNNELWITGDLAHYHDPRHFYGGVHDYIIDSTVYGRHMITVENVAEFERKFIANINSYSPWASTAEELHKQHR